jgi:hypothetical protein
MRIVAAAILPHHDDHPPRHLPAYHRFVIVHMPWITMVFIVLTLIWLQVQARRSHFVPLTAGTPPRIPIPSPFPLLLKNRDEL